jgi:hypothetical protein
MVGLFLNHAVKKHPSKWPLLAAENAGTGGARPRFLGLHKQSKDHVRRSWLQSRPQKKDMVSHLKRPKVDNQF